MNPVYIVLPVIFHLFTAIVLLLFWGQTKSQKWISLTGSLISLIITIILFVQVWGNGIISMQAGGWEAPFGITFVADTFSAVMVMLVGIAGFAVVLYSMGSIRNARVRFGYFPMLHFLLMGLNGAFLTGDIFNLYVWFEIIIIASFVLITLGGEKAQIEGAIKYVTMNLLASVIFLTGIAVLYGLVGSLNMADLSERVAQIENRGLVHVTAILFFVGFGIKSAVFPLYFWLPASYHTPPPAISAIFGGLLTKVGVYAILRVFTLIFIPDEFMAQLISAIAILTILTGGIGSLVQSNIRKIFSYLIICHIGFMIAGLAVFTETGLEGSLFYLIHDIMVKTNVFLVCGLIYKIRGSFHLKSLGNIYRDYPKLSLLMAIPLFSLVGIPPLSGFWGKLFLVEGAFMEKHFWLIGFIILGSFLTLLIIAKLWAEVYWKKGVDIPKKEFIKYFHELQPYQRAAMVGAIALLSLVSLYIGLGAEHIIQVTQRIATELMDKTAYIKAVMG